MKRKFFIIGAILFLIAIFWFVNTRKPQQSGWGATYVTPAPIQSSVFPTSLTDKTILYTGEPQFKFPQHVPHITVATQRGFEQESSRLFSLNNFAGAPQIINGSRGRTALAIQNNIGGAVSENPLSFAFTLASPSGFFVSGDTTKYTNISTATLKAWSLLPESFDTTLSYVRYFRSSNDSHPVEQSQPGGAFLAQVDLIATIGGLPLYINDINSPTFSAGFDGSGQLVTIRGFILPSVEKSKKEVAIISYQEALARLKNGKGVLSRVSLVPTTGEVFYSGEIPSNIVIEKASLGYVYSPLQDYLVPAFVFTGGAITPIDNQRVVTTTVVSAL